MLREKYFLVLLSLIFLFGNTGLAQEVQTNTGSAFASYAWDGTTANQNISVGYIEGSRLEVEREKTKLVQLRSGGATYVGLNLADTAFPNNGEPKSVAITVR